MRALAIGLCLALCACGERAAEGVDTDVVGKWIHTFKTGHTVSDTYLHLHADGRFEYSSRTESAHPGTDTQWSPVTTGTWKAEGGKLFYRLAESGPWTETGRYELSGRNSMVITPPGGMAVLYRRND